MRNIRPMSVDWFVGVFLSLACNVVYGQISAEEGRWVIARGADIATKCAEFITSEHADREGGSVFQNAELVRLVTAAPSSWRFYSRDRGILIAIDVTADVSSTVLNSGGAKIARAAEAVIRQEREMSIADRVTVVFIDPATHKLRAKLHYGVPVYSPPIPMGGYLGWEYGSRPVVIAPFTGGLTHQACGCR